MVTVSAALRRFPVDVFLQLLGLILVGNLLTYVLFTVLGLINVSSTTSIVLLAINVIVLVILASIPTAIVGAIFLLWSA